MAGGPGEARRRGRPTEKGTKRAVGGGASPHATSGRMPGPSSLQRRARRGTAREDAEAAMGSRGGRSVRVVPRGGRDGRGSGVRRGTGRRGDVDRHARRVPRVDDGGVHAAWTATCTPPSTSRCATRPGGGRGDAPGQLSTSSASAAIIRRVGCWMALAFGVARARTKILDDTGNSNVRMV